MISFYFSLFHFSLFRSENQNVKNENGEVKNKNRNLNQKAKWQSENQKVKKMNGKVKNKNEITICPPPPCFRTKPIKLRVSIISLCVYRWFSRYVIAAMLVDGKQKIAH